MDRLIYDPETKTIIDRIVNCEGTSTGTPFEMIEDTPENIDMLINTLQLVYPNPSLEIN
jgi:hypothetical protein